MRVFDIFATGGFLARTTSDVLRPRLLPFLLLFLTMAGGLLAVEFGMFRFVESQSPAALVVGTNDDFAVITHKVNTLRGSDVPSIITLGGSSMRESLHAAQEMEVLLRNATGMTFRFENFASSGQDYSEDLYLIDNLPRLAPGSMVFMHLTPRRMEETAEDAEKALLRPRYLLKRNTALRNFLETYGISSSPKYNTVRFFPIIIRYLKSRVGLSTAFKTNLSRLKDLNCGYECASQVLSFSWFKNPFEQRKYVSKRYIKSPLSNRMKSSLSILEDGIAVEGVAYLGNVIAASIRLIKDKGALPVILDLPRDPILLKKEISVAPQHRQIVEAIRKAGGRYVDMRGMTEIGSEHFYDLVHPINTGREKVVPVFLKIVAGLVSWTNGAEKTQSN